MRLIPVTGTNSVPLAVAVLRRDVDNGVVIMVRVASMFALGGLFLAISPGLQKQAWGALGRGVTAMDVYAPYSYIAGVLLLIVTMLVSFYRGAQAR